MKYEIYSNEIKGVAEKEGGVLVKYNISYPKIKSVKNDAFVEAFNRFYSAVAENFKLFSERELLKKAQKNYSDDFVPFGSVLRFICAYSKGEIISILTDASVFSGKKTETKRLSQNWHTEKKRLLLFEDFFLHDEKKTIINAICEEAKLRQNAENANFFENYEKTIRKHFSKKNFYLTPKGYGFFYPEGCVSAGKGADVFFLLGYKGKGMFNPY